MTADRLQVRRLLCSRISFLHCAAFVRKRCEDSVHSDEMHVSAGVSADAFDPSFRRVTADDFSAMPASVPPQRPARLIASSVFHHTSSPRTSTQEMNVPTSGGSSSSNIVNTFEIGRAH